MHRGRLKRPAKASSDETASRRTGMAQDPRGGHAAGELSHPRNGRVLVRFRASLKHWREKCFNRRAGKYENLHLAVHESRTSKSRLMNAANLSTVDPFSYTVEHGHRGNSELLSDRTPSQALGSQPDRFVAPERTTRPSAVSSRGLGSADAGVNPSRMVSRSNSARLARM